jgi:RNA-directed DNA polymerase
VVLPMGPATAAKTAEFPYYDAVRKTRALHSAWRKVYNNGISSKSLETRSLVKEFNSNSYLNIHRIYRQLLKGKFRFAPAKGVPIPRPNKPPRPIVIAPIANRIVQRSILDVLQCEDSIYEYINTPFSFGGIKDYDEPRGVHTAIRAAQAAIAQGAKWYIKSDINNFFTNIPKRKVTDIISSLIHDDKFVRLFEAAIDVELENMAELGRKAELFPIFEIGVAQGCCLSPLIGNILLYHFDAGMNGKGVTCLRYIDDFIILAATRKKAEAAFEAGLKVLKSLGLDAYAPNKEISKPPNDRKAKIGLAAGGIDFLGCEILGDRVKPNSRSRDRLLEKIEAIITESKNLMNKPHICCQNKRSLIHTLESISNVLEGWGNQYIYCNDLGSFEQIDRSIHERLSKYLSYYTNCLKSFDDRDFANRRRLLGVHLLSDSFREKLL